MADTALNTISTDPVAPASLGDRAVTISDSAAKRVLVLRGLEGDDSLMLRITVSGGGCSGFQYGFTFDENFEDGDTRVQNGGVTLLIDPMSIQYLAGAEIDYREDIEGAQFVIRNPNAATTCGCGSSFSM
jgi:iron-sulfur cluster insertion protein